MDRVEGSTKDMVVREKECYVALSLCNVFIALCTSNLSITALCKLDFVFVFDFAGESTVVFGFSGGLLPEISRRWGGTIMGVVRGGGGHCRTKV